MQSRIQNRYDWSKNSRQVSALPIGGRHDAGKLPWLMRISSERAVLVSLSALASDDEPESLRRRRLEAILLLSREPISSRKLAHLTHLADATEARTLIRHLNEIYDRDGRAVRIEEVAGGFQLMTRPQFAKWLRKLEHVSLEQRLTDASLETLALVAYRQPILRADIEATRGAGCGEILKQLMERDLVAIVGRSEDLGRPYLYGTTRRFLQLFGLQSLNRLPRADWVRELDLKPATPADENQTSAIDHICLRVSTVDSETRD